MSTPAAIKLATPALTNSVELVGSAGPVYSLACSPEGDALASAGFGQVNLWQGEGMGELSTFQGHSSYLWGVAWSPGGDRIASGNSRGIVQIRDVASGEMLMEMKPVP